MKKFIIEVPEGITKCHNCFFEKESTCKYLSENDFCDHYDFNKLTIEEYNENRN